MERVERRADWSARPGPSEIPESYRAYVGHVPDGDLMATMERDGRELTRLLRRLPPVRGTYRYAPEKWTVREVVGHVIDVERVLACRALWFARAAAGELPGFDENAWTPVSGAGARDLADLTNEFELVRAASIALFRSMERVGAERRGIANGVEFSARAMAWIVTGHAIHHRRILEERYLS